VPRVKPLQRMPSMPICNFRHWLLTFVHLQDESDSKERLGPINVVIRILQILQLEHVFPTLENIKECYYARAELYSRNNISIDNALQWACDHRKVIIERTRVPSHGNLSLYRLADSHLGICSNPKVGTNIDYIEVWPQLQTFFLDNIGEGNRLEPGKSMYVFYFHFNCTLLYFVQFNDLSSKINVKRWLCNCCYIKYE